MESTQQAASRLGPRTGPRSFALPTDVITAHALPTGGAREALRRMDYIDPGPRSRAMKLSGQRIAANRRRATATILFFKSERRRRSRRPTARERSPTSRSRSVWRMQIASARLSEGGGDAFGDPGPRQRGIPGDVDVPAGEVGAQ